MNDLKKMIRNGWIILNIIAIMLNIAIGWPSGQAIIGLNIAIFSLIVIASLKKPKNNI